MQGAGKVVGGVALQGRGCGAYFFGQSTAWLRLVAEAETLTVCKGQAKLYVGWRRGWKGEKMGA